MTSSGLNNKVRGSIFRLSFWKRPWMAALLAMLLALTVEQVIEHFARDLAHAQERVSVAENLSVLCARLEGVIGSNLLLVNGLTAVISAHPEIDQAEFSRIVRGMVDQRHALRNIAGAPDMVISLMYPLSGNEAAIGLDFRTHPTQSATALRAESTGEPVVAGPLKLQQGGTAIIVRAPVFIPASKPSEKPRFWGLVSAVLDIDKLYRLASLDNPNSKIRLAIRGRDGLGAQGAVFYGDAGIFGQDPVRKDVVVPGGSWQVAAVPISGWGQVSEGMWLIRLLGGLATLMAGVMAYRLAVGGHNLSTASARLRALLDTIPDLVWLKGPDGDYLNCNPRFEHYFGASENEIKGKTDHDFVPAELADFFRDNDQAAIEAGGPLVNEEWVSFASDGHRELLETIKVPVRDASGELLGVLGIARDITERKQAEERIVNLNRIYALLSGINESIVRLRDADALFRESCRIAVEVGGFRMAWLGLADQSSGQILPVASAGVDDGYIDHLHVSPGDDEYGRDPTGQALKAGRIVVCDDIDNDPGMATWRDDALARGYRSSIALPIKSADQVHGVFSLYADRAHFFDQQELRLLEELALDIGFALDFMAAEKLARQGQAVLNSIFEALPDLFFMIDAAGVILEFRARRGRDMFVPPEYFLGKRMQDVLPPEPSAQWIEHLRRVKEQGGLATFECDLDFPSGRYRLEARLSALPDSDSVIAVVRDITQQHQDHLALIESEQRYRHLFLHNPVPILIYERNSLRILAVNEAFLEHYGYRMDEIMAMRLVDLYPEGEKKAIVELIPSLQGLAYVGEWHHLKKDGTAMVIEVHSHDIDYEGHDARIGVITDITSRKQAEIALREQESFFRLIAENMADMVAVLDRDGRRLYNSPSYRTLFGDPDMLKGSDSFANIHPDDREGVRQVFRTTVETGVGSRMNFRFVLRDGSEREMESQGGVILGPDGKVDRVVVVSRDVTDRNLMEDEIRQLNAELEERVRMRTAELAAANKELETFTYSVSHDLKAPLRGIDGYSRLLLEDHIEQLDEEGRLFLGNVRHGVDQMSQLIEDLLAYSRMERRSLNDMDIDLDRQLSTLLAERQDEFNAKGVVIRLDLAVHSVRADPDGLNMVLRNLIDNAVKFSRNSQPPTIEIKSVARPELAILSVKDNGIGFDMRFQDRIFEVFQRLQRSEDYPGTGVGLAIVRKAMQRMGGRVWVESKPGQGATFFLELPR